MMDGWRKFFDKLESAGWLADYISLLQGEAMLRSRQACQTGQPDEVRRDALADVRFCLCKADEAAEALADGKRKANPAPADGFREGGSVLA